MSHYKSYQDFVAEMAKSVSKSASAAQKIIGSILATGWSVFIDIVVSVLPDVKRGNAAIISHKQWRVIETSVKPTSGSYDISARLRNKPGKPGLRAQDFGAQDFEKFQRLQQIRTI